MQRILMQCSKQYKYRILREEHAALGKEQELWLLLGAGAAVGSVAAGQRSWREQ